MQNPHTALHPAEPSLFLWVEFALARLEGKTKPRKLIRALCDRGTMEKGSEQTLKHSQATILQETLILKTYFLVCIFYPVTAGKGLSRSPAGGCLGSFLRGAVSWLEEPRNHRCPPVLGLLHKTPPQLLGGQLEGCEQDIGHPGLCHREVAPCYSW